MAVIFAYSSLSASGLATRPTSQLCAGIYPFIKVLPRRAWDGEPGQAYSRHAIFMVQWDIIAGSNGRVDTDRRSESHLTG